MKLVQYAKGYWCIRKYSINRMCYLYKDLSLSDSWKSFKELQGRSDFEDFISPKYTRVLKIYLRNVEQKRAKSLKFWSI